MIQGKATAWRAIFGLFLFAIVLTVTLSACGLLDPSPRATVTEPSGNGDECENVSSLTAGSAIYRCECAGCHGLDGVSLADDVTDIREFGDSAKFYVSLSTGPGTMPAFPGLDSLQRAVLFEYVRDSLVK